MTKEEAIEELQGLLDYWKYIKMYDNIENVILLSDDVESKIIDNFYELIKEV